MSPGLHEALRIAPTVGPNWTICTSRYASNSGHPSCAESAVWGRFCLRRQRCTDRLWRTSSSIRPPPPVTGCCAGLALPAAQPSRFQPSLEVPDDHAAVLKLWSKRRAGLPVSRDDAGASRSGAHGCQETPETYLVTVVETGVRKSRHWVALK